MKKIALLIALSIITFSCKNTEEEKVSETTNVEKTVDVKEIIYKGDFVYLADAAVLKGENFIYGVTLDKKMHELANKVRPVKTTDYDMVPVAVKGVISKKSSDEEGWDEIITITEIIMVGTKPSKIDIKLEDKK